MGAPHLPMRRYVPRRPETQRRPAGTNHRGSSSLGQYGLVDPGDVAEVAAQVVDLANRTPNGTSAAEKWIAFQKSQAIALGRSKAHDGPVSIVIGTRLGQLLKSLAELPIDSPAHFGPCRVIRADDQQAPDGHGFENVSHRNRQLLRINIRRIKNVHNSNDIHSTRQGVRL